ncbi:MAG: GGDEF domain-containing protein [Deltaproteobacteria bacterium]|nr:GGDEF domain-containing protein [Deltaproteobacteria bacterium]
MTVLDGHNVLTSRDLFREVVDSLEDGVYVVDRDRRITYWNRGAEHLAGYTAAEILGHRCADNLLLHVNEQGEVLCLAGCPLAATMARGAPVEAQIYLLHKDGHRVPVRVRALPVRDSQGLIVGAVETFADVSRQLAIEQHVAELRRLAMLDELTGLANRRYLENALRSRLEEHQRYGWRLGAVFLDIDHFKAINDSLGHAAGDRMLQMVARTLAATSRAFDLVGRFGGEEFVAIVANVDKVELLRIAERYRNLVQQSRLGHPDGARQVTISVGATLATMNDTMETLLCRADQLMYESKQRGRNRVTSDVS